MEVRIVFVDRHHSFYFATFGGLAGNIHRVYIHDSGRALHECCIMHRVFLLYFFPRYVLFLFLFHRSVLMGQINLSQGTLRLQGYTEKVQFQKIYSKLIQHSQYSSMCALFAHPHAFPIILI